MTGAQLIQARHAPPAMRREVGVVVIGRNEGPRLKACLEAVADIGCPMVYVDSGSTDESLQAAAESGATVVVLDTTIPFTAARARNAGWERLVKLAPEVELVQFFDGDCLPAPEWLQTACAYLERHPQVAAVCGRRREQFPRESRYNLLCDIEWDGPTGDIEEFGGGVLVRREALDTVGGYTDSVIAAEDTELSVRLRKAGWSLTRIPEEMEAHDAKMTRFSQWWRRAVRSGHAHAEMHARHGAAPIRCRTREARSSLIWGMVVPVLVVVLAWPTSGWSLLLLSGYVLLYARILRRAASGMPLADAHVYAASCVLAKFPELLGLLKFHLNRLTGRKPQIIEYKPVPKPSSTTRPADSRRLAVAQPASGNSAFPSDT